MDLTDTCESTELRILSINSQRVHVKTLHLFHSLDLIANVDTVGCVICRASHVQIVSVMVEKFLSSYK